MNIKEIAKCSGVSAATVSRVINQSGYVKEETRQKVLAAIRENNYVPSEIARSLSVQENRNIGVIIPDIENEFFSKMISGVSEVADEYQYNIVFLGTNETLKKEHDYLSVVRSQRMKGVIITPISESDPYTKKCLIELEESGVPVIVVDRDVIGKKFDGVFVDNQGGSYDGVTELILAGHKKIAIISGPETSKPGKDRLRGYRAAMEDNDLPIPEEYIVCGEFKIKKAYECAKELMNLPDPPTAIFSSNNLSTLGCLKYFTEAGLKPGRDVSIIGFDDIDALKIIDYKISVIDRDARMQGKEAMKLLMECFQDTENRQKGKRVYIPYNLVLRGSEKLKK